MARSRSGNVRIVRLRWVIGRIPRGRVMTYGGVARAAGLPGSARLTVRALRTSSELPWHRVVASGGRIALGGEDGAEQRLRLEIEGVAFRGGRVRMDLHEWHVRTPPRLRAERTGGRRRSLRRSTGGAGTVRGRTG